MTFPCPFCRSPHVHMTAATQRFAHYRCVECAEVWTAMAALAPRAGADPQTRGAQRPGSRPAVGDKRRPTRRH